MENIKKISSKDKVLPKIKSFKEETKSFKQAAKKSNFSENDLKKLIEESKILT